MSYEQKQNLQSVLNENATANNKGILLTNNQAGLGTKVSLSSAPSFNPSNLGLVLEASYPNGQTGIYKKTVYNNDITSNENISIQSRKGRLDFPYQFYDIDGITPNQNTLTLAFPKICTNPISRVIPVTINSFPADDEGDIFVSDYAILTGSPLTITQKYPYNVIFCINTFTQPLPNIQTSRSRVLTFKNSGTGIITITAPYINRIANNDIILNPNDVVKIAYSGFSGYQGNYETL